MIEWWKLGKGWKYETLMMSTENIKYMLEAEQVFNVYKVNLVLK